MKTSGNTILITGGGSGIGLETAKQFSRLGNKIIIVGRNKKKLESAIEGISNVHAIAADVTNEKEVKDLVQQITQNFPSLNILINNAGKAALHDVSKPEEISMIARSEMETNYFAILNLTSALLPILKAHKESAIVNISSVVAYAPGLSLPTYSASKAALHSYTQALRLSLKSYTNVKVFEVLPPLVDTEFAKEIKSDKKISAEQVAKELVLGLEKDRFEIRVASAEQLYKTFLSQADKVVLALNGLELN